MSETVVSYLTHVPFLRFRSYLSTMFSAATLISLRNNSSTQKDTVQHIFDAVDHLDLIELLEVFTDVHELVIVRR